MATVTGTAVVVVKKEENENIKIEEEYNDTIPARVIENMILINQYIQKLSDDKLLYNEFM